MTVTRDRLCCLLVDLSAKRSELSFARKSHDDDRYRERRYSGTSDDRLRNEIIMAEYIRKAKPFDNLAALRAGYATSIQLQIGRRELLLRFSRRLEHEPNSPEANGIIWFSRTMASQCETKTVPYGSPTKSAIISPEECRRYVQHSSSKPIGTRPAPASQLGFSWTQ